jgi:hypothetical protein
MMHNQRLIKKPPPQREGDGGREEAVARAERSGAGANREAPWGADREGKAQPLFERVAAPTGGRNMAWQPSGVRRESGM